MLTDIGTSGSDAPLLAARRWVLRPAAPYFATLTIDTSMRVSNARAKAELGWTPALPTYRQGVRAPRS
ncbi:hypothetical protein [Microtetraspora malaysiensis]|uniref:hypothetical protein n=1 Tax=Microtetraspora malaysiensis TaxID=161358 RepID=UPI003D8A6BF7